MGLGLGVASRGAQHRGLREGLRMGGSGCSTRRDSRRPHSALALWVGPRDSSRKLEPALPITPSE